MIRTYFFISPAFLVLLISAFAGCSSSNDQESVQPPAVQVDGEDNSQTAGIALLEDEADRLAALQQGFCPVSGEPLGSMGKPIKLMVEGREVYICCSGCEDTLRGDPQKYFAKLDQSPDRSE